MALPSSPLINGQPTTLLALTHGDLASSPLLEPLREMMNAGFFATHKDFWTADVPRFSSTEQLLSELHSEATMYVLTLDGNPTRVVGTVTDEPYVYHEDNEWAPRLEGDGVGEYRRCVRLLVTDPSLQGQGLGSWLMKHVESAVGQRGEAAGAKAVHWVLATVGEVNAAFYTRRGWRTTTSAYVSAGKQKNMIPLTVVTMDRVIPLDA